MERKYAGWLIKSPPEKTTQGPWKLFHSKWRRRYFVLYSARPSSVFQSSDCTAQLSYYEDEELSKEIGKIDLKHCQEMHTHLQADTYKHVFALKTLHNGIERTYCLAAKTEQEMNQWKKNLSSVLCLYDSGFYPMPQLPSFTSEPPSSSSSSSLLTPSPHHKPHVITKGSATVSRHKTSRKLANVPAKISRSATDICDNPADDASIARREKPLKLNIQELKLPSPKDKTAELKPLSHTPSKLRKSLLNLGLRFKRRPSLEPVTPTTADVVTCGVAGPSFDTPEFLRPRKSSAMPINFLTPARVDTKNPYQGSAGSSVSLADAREESWVEKAMGKSRRIENYSETSGSGSGDDKLSISPKSTNWSIEDWGEEDEEGGGAVGGSGNSLSSCCSDGLLLGLGGAPPPVPPREGIMRSMSNVGTTMLQSQMHPVRSSGIFDYKILGVEGEGQTGGEWTQGRGLEGDGTLRREARNAASSPTLSRSRREKGGEGGEEGKIPVMNDTGENDSEDSGDYDYPFEMFSKSDSNFALIKNKMNTATNRREVHAQVTAAAAAATQHHSRKAEEDGDNYDRLPVAELTGGNHRKEMMRKMEHSRGTEWKQEHDDNDRYDRLPVSSASKSWRKESQPNVVGIIEDDYDVLPGMCSRNQGELDEDEEEGEFEDHYDTLPVYGEELHEDFTNIVVTEDAYDTLPGLPGNQGDFEENTTGEFEDHYDVLPGLSHYPEEEYDEDMGVMEDHYDVLPCMSSSAPNLEREQWEKNGGGFGREEDLGLMEDHYDVLPGSAYHGSGTRVEGGEEEGEEMGEECGGSGVVEGLYDVLPTLYSIEEDSLAADDTGTKEDLSDAPYNFRPRPTSLRPSPRPSPRHSLTGDSQCHVSRAPRDPQSRDHVTSDENLYDTLPKSQRLAPRGGHLEIKEQEQVLEKEQDGGVYDVPNYSGMNRGGTVFVRDRDQKTKEQEQEQEEQGQGQEQEQGLAETKSSPTATAPAATATSTTIIASTTPQVCFDVTSTPMIGRNFRGSSSTANDAVYENLPIPSPSSQSNMTTSQSSTSNNTDTGATSSKITTTRTNETRRTRVPLPIPITLGASSPPSFESQEDSPRLYHPHPPSSPSSHPAPSSSPLSAPPSDRSVSIKFTRNTRSFKRRDNKTTRISPGVLSSQINFSEAVTEEQQQHQQQQQQQQQCSPSADARTSDSKAPDAATSSDATSSDDRKSDAGQSDAGKSDAGQSDARKSDAGQSDARKSDAGQSDARKSDAGQSDAGKSDACQSDTRISEAGQSDAKKSEDDRSREPLETLAAVTSPVRPRDPEVSSLECEVPEKSDSAISFPAVIKPLRRQEESRTEKNQPVLDSDVISSILSKKLCPDPEIKTSADLSAESLPASLKSTAADLCEKTSPVSGLFNGLSSMSSSTIMSVMSSVAARHSLLAASSRLTPPPASSHGLQTILISSPLRHSQSLRVIGSERPVISPKPRIRK